MSAMATLISDTSEALYCAGWYVDCEYALWARVLQFRRTGACDSWGMSSSASVRGFVEDLTEASEALGRWARWAKDGAIDIPLDEWELLWTAADPRFHMLAESAPSCGSFGPMVPHYEGSTFSYFSSCREPADHNGDHVYRDKSGAVVVGAVA